MGVFPLLKSLRRWTVNINGAPGIEGFASSAGTSSSCGATTISFGRTGSTKARPAVTAAASATRRGQRPKTRVLDRREDETGCAFRPRRKNANLKRKDGDLENRCSNPCLWVRSSSGSDRGWSVTGCRVLRELYRPRVLGQWFDGIRIYAAASSPTRSPAVRAGAGDPRRRADARRRPARVPQPERPAAGYSATAPAANQMSEGVEDRVWTA